MIPVHSTRGMSCKPQIETLSQRVKIQSWQNTIQWVKVLTAKPHDPNSIPRTNNMVEERELMPTSCPLTVIPMQLPMVGTNKY